MNQAMHYITRKLEFDAAHRVLLHESKCRHLHGHRYVLEVTVGAPSLDLLGRVVDFGILKRVLGGWLDSFWDHNILLHPNDPLAGLHLHGFREDNDPQIFDLATGVFGGKDPYIFPKDTNPTAENIGSVFFSVAQNLLNEAEPDSPLTVVQVRVYETPNCWADAHFPFGWKPDVEVPAVPKSQRTMRTPRS